MEQREIRTTEWVPSVKYANYRYICWKCRVKDGIMMRRYVTNRDGETHKEYKIVCEACKTGSSAHKHPEIAVAEWKSKDEEPDYLPHRNRKYYQRKR